MEWPGPSAVNVIQPSAPSGSTRARLSPMVMDTAEWSAASAGPIRCLSKVICQSNVIPAGRQMVSASVQIRCTSESVTRADTTTWTGIAGTAGSRASHRRNVAHRKIMRKFSEV